MANSEKPTKNSNTLLGLLLGLILGVLLSAVFTFYLKGGNATFGKKNEIIANSPAIPSTPTDLITSTKKAESPSASETEDTSTKELSSPSEEQKPTFDFYNILPNDAPIKKKPDNQKSKPIITEYFLQVGAYKNEVSANNIKTKLAILGIEAVIQTANRPEEGLIHRIMVGPLSVAQLDNTKELLTNNGFEFHQIKEMQATQ